MSQAITPLFLNYLPLDLIEPQNDPKLEIKREQNRYLRGPLLCHLQIDVLLSQRPLFFIPLIRALFQVAIARVSTAIMKR